MGNMNKLIFVVSQKVK